MKFNCKELAEYSYGEAAIEGRLHHKRITNGFSQSGFKEKWFKLRANILFYFSASEIGKAYDKKPVGAFILENATVQYEMNAEAPFAFSIIFHDDLDKKHLFSGRTEEYVNQWVNFLKQSSYEFWRSQLLLLQTRLCMLTGKDPLLMYPRNEGTTTAFAENNHNTDGSQKLKKSPGPSFRSYVVSDKEKRPTKSTQVPTENLLMFTNENIISNVDLIDSELKNVQIDPPPAPPKRPARANRLKTNNTSPNLIEL